MKLVVTALFLLGGALGLHAQEGVLTIDQDPRISTLLQLYAEMEVAEGFYQIQVGFGSYQKAQELKAQVDTDFSGWGSRIVFESPTYRVRLGRFSTKLEAERRYLEVRKKYPAAILLKPESNR